jgi:hypothetical protein
VEAFTSRTREPGSFRIGRQRRGYEPYLDPNVRRARRIGRILASIQDDLHQGGTAHVRQILRGPVELYRIELELPELAYQRTTILDRETLTALLEQTPDQDLRERFTFRSPPS